LYIKFERSNDNIKFSNKESDLILSIAQKYSLAVHDLILLSVLSIRDKNEFSDIKVKFDCDKASIANRL